MSHIFISYSRKDIDFAGKIVQALADNNLDTWIDWKSIPKGEDWEQEIYRGIEEADAFLFLISPDSVASQMCNKEIDHAVKNGKRILPIVIRDAEPKSIHPEISKRNWIFCRDGQDDFNKAIEETRTTIHTDYEWLKYHTELQVKALKWEQKKDTSRLLRGNELRDAEQQLAELNAQEDPQPTKLQREYILASQRNEVRERRQITTSLGIGLVIVTMLAMFSWNQRNSALNSEATAVAEANAKATALVNEENARATAQAEKEHAEEQQKLAESRALSAESLVIIKEQPELSVLMAIEAYNKSSTIEAKRALIGNLNAIAPIEHILNVHVPLSGIAISPNGETICLSSGNQSVELLSIDAKNNIEFIKHLDFNVPFEDFLFSENSKNLIFALSTGEILVLDSVTRDVSKVLNYHSDRITSLIMGSTGLLASSDSSGYVVVWNVENDQIISEHYFGESPIRSIDFNREGNLIAVLDGNDTISIWNYPQDIMLNSFKDKNSPLTILFDGSDNIISSGEKTLLWSEKGELIRAISDEFAVETVVDKAKNNVVISFLSGKISIYDLASIDNPVNYEIGHTAAVRHISFDNKGRMVSVSDDGRMIIWKYGEEKVSVFGNIIEKTDDFPVVRFNRGDKALIYSTGKNVIIQDLSNLDDKKSIQIGQHISALAISQDDNLLAVGTSNGNVQVWDLQQYKKVYEESIGDNFPIGDLSFDFSSTQLAIARFDSVISLLNLKTLTTKEYQVINPDASTWPANNVTFTMDGEKIIASYENGFILVWDIRNNSYETRLSSSGSDIIFAFDYSPKKDILVFGSGINIFTLTPTNAGAKISIIGSLKIPSSGSLPSGLGIIDKIPFLYSIGLSPDTSFVLSPNANDANLLLWDMSTRSMIGQFIGHKGRINSIDISESNNLAVSGSFDKGAGVIILWDLRPDTWIEKACQIVSRNFTQVEWQQYFPNEPYRLTCPQWPAGE